MEFEKEVKMSNILKLYYWAVSIWRRTIYFVDEVLCYIKRFIQRGKRGWGDADLWDMDIFLTNIILDMLIKLKKTKNGTPETFDEATGKWDFNEERWDKILEEMIDGFSIIKQCHDSKYKLDWNRDIDEKEKQRIEKHMKKAYPDWRFVTKEEEAKIDLAFKNFVKYYCCLWD